MGVRRYVDRYVGREVGREVGTTPPRSGHPPWAFGATYLLSQYFLRFQGVRGTPRRSGLPTCDTRVSHLRACSFLWFLVRKRVTPVVSLRNY